MVEEISGPELVKDVLGYNGSASRTSRSMRLFPSTFLQGSGTAVKAAVSSFTSLSSRFRFVPIHAYDFLQTGGESHLAGTWMAGLEILPKTAALVTEGAAMLCCAVLFDRAAAAARRWSKVQWRSCKSVIT